MTEEKFGVPKLAPGYKQKLNPEYVALWESYLDEGMSGKGVADIFGVNKNTVAKYYPDKVWTREQQFEHFQTMRDASRIMRSL